MDEKRTPICSRCRKELVMHNTKFSYLGRDFSAEVLRCPECGVVYLPEDFVRGRMADVEAELEDK